jgi:hypothetical protein
MWPWSAPPAAISEQPLQVLASRDQQGLDVHLPQPAESEPSQPVPVLFAEQRLDPHLPLPHRLLVGSGLVVGAHAVEVLDVQGPMDLAPLTAHGASRFERAGIADGGVSAVDHDAFGVLGFPSPKHLAFGAAVLVVLRIVGEAGRSIERRPLVEVRQRDVGVDLLVFDADDVLDRAVGRVAGCKLRDERGSGTLCVKPRGMPIGSRWRR